MVGTGVVLIVNNFEVTVEKLVYGGDGLSRLDGRVVFTPFVLPGERIRARSKQEKPGLIRASVPLLRALWRLPLPARAVRHATRDEAGHPGRGTAPPRQVRATAGDRGDL